MRSLFLGLMCCLLASSAFAAGDWTICWSLKNQGISALGQVNQCKKCFSRPGLPPPNMSNCQYFRFEGDAADWWSKNCDCP